MILNDINKNEIIKYANDELKSVLYIAFNYIDAEKIKFLLSLDNDTLIKQLKNYMRNNETPLDFIMINAIIMREKILLKGENLLPDKIDFINQCNEILKIYPYIVESIIKTFDIEWEKIKTYHKLDSIIAKLEK